METFNKELDNTINSLFSFSRAITAEKYMEDILELIVTVTTNVTDINICSIWLVDETKNPRRLKLKASHGIEAEYVKNRSLDMNEGVVGFVADSQQTITIEDVLKEPLFKEKKMAKSLGLVSMLSIAMKENNNVIGVLNCFTTQAYDFSPTMVNMMTKLANQSTIVIRNTESMVRERLVQEELATRKKMEKAKNILMHRLNIGIDEAQNWIQKCSRKSLQPLRQIAEAILISDNI